MDPSDAVDPRLKDDVTGLGGTWHVHPAGTLIEEQGNVRTTKRFNQPPSGRDVKESGSGISLVVGAANKKVYFYDSAGAIGHPMKLKKFLKGC